MAGGGAMRVKAVIAMIALMGLAAQGLTACGSDAGAARQEQSRGLARAPGHEYARVHVQAGDLDGRRGNSDTGSAAPSRLEVLRSGAADRGFARALALRRFEFPQDHGPHPAYRHEWWYFTGHLKAGNGERFGFEVTFFRVALAPPGMTAAVGASHWRARQIYAAHFAVTDIDRRTFHSTQRFARDALGLAGAQAAPFRVWVDGWSVAEQSAEGGRAGAAGEWALRVSDPSYGLALRMQPLSAPVLNGDQGLSVKSNEPGAASYYYSIPRLAVRGQLVRGGRAGATTRTLDVSGTAWLDREWGSGSLGPHQQGWDWYALQFADGSALMFYALRDDDGARDPHSAGTWIAPDGSSRPLASRDVRIEALDHWISPHGTRYPSRWRIRVGSLGLDVTATPVLADQELDTTPQYWEGDVDVMGTRGGRPLPGQGYVELVGYGG